MKKLLQEFSITTIPDGKIITTSNLKKTLFKSSFSSILEFHLDTCYRIANNYFSNVELVYYPGSSSMTLIDILLNTNCTTLVCVDKVDKYFFDTLNYSVVNNKKVQDTLEFSDVINGITETLTTLQFYYPKAVNNDEKLIDSVLINNKRLEMKFQLNNKDRIVVFYLEDATNFIPPELNKRVDLLVEQGFYLNTLYNILNPKMILYEMGNVQDYHLNNYKHQNTVELLFCYIYKSISFFTEYLELTDIDDLPPMIKSYILKQGIDVRTNVLASNKSFPLFQIADSKKVFLTNDQYNKLDENGLITFDYFFKK